MTYCIVISTCENREKAKSLSKQILKSRLAACVQLSEIASLYHWEGEIVEDQEIKLLIKTKDQDYKKLKNLIIKVHSYQIPEIIKIPISDGYEKYLGWISDETT